MELIEEAGAVLDPTRQASDATEAGLRATAPPALKAFLATSDAAAAAKGEGEPMAESDPDSWVGQEREALYGAFHSWDRQFDETKGGGFADETFAVLDPTRAASPATEQRLRDDQASAIRPPGPDIKATTLETSDDLDREGGVTPPHEREAQPETTPEGDGEWFSGADPTDPDDPGYPDWFPWVIDNIELLLAALVLVYVLSLTKPLMEIGAEVVK